MTDYNCNESSEEAALDKNEEVSDFYSSLYWYVIDSSK